MNLRTSKESRGVWAAIVALCALGFSGVPSAHACGVCFTGDGTVLTGAVNGMLFAMLGAVALVLGAFLTFIVYLARRERQAILAAEPLSGES